MKTLIKTLVAVMISAYTAPLFSFHQKNTLPEIANTYQKAQAKELLGAKQYKKSIKVKSESSHILSFVEKRLPKKYKKDARKISETLIQEARRNKLDPMFLMAVIMTESSFNPEAKGLHGEIGLMQILPKTAVWLAEKHKIKGPVALKNPHYNIRMGAAYFGSLRNRFDGVGNRYISAYNMGAGNVKRLVASKIEPKIYSDKVLTHYKGIYKHIETKSVKKSSKKSSSKMAAL